MAKRNVDTYANRAFIDCTMSAANTLTFTQIRFAVGTFQGIGLRVHKLHWFPLASVLAELVATADILEMALTLRDDLTTLDPTNQAIIAAVNLQRDAARTAEGQVIPTPYITSFEDLPQGGLLLPANPIFAACASSGFAAAGRYRLVMFYTFVELSDRESIELLQTIIPGNV